MIKKQWVPQELFDFNEIDTIDVIEQIKRLNPKKASPIDSMPSKKLQENCKIFVPFLHSSF